MNDNDVREAVLEKLSKMACSKTVCDLNIIYVQLKSMMRDYKGALEFDLRYGKENNENDN